MRPYTHGDWSLYSREVVLRNGNGTQRIFFFSRNEPRSGVPTAMPRGYKVEVSNRTGMPYIRKDPTANQGNFGWLKRYFN